MDELRVSDDLVIPASELTWRFDPSGGPGGQHANRSSTRVELLFDVANSDVLDGAMKARIMRHRSIDLGVISVRVSETRSQWKNRQIARERLVELLTEALRPPPPRRKRTRPGRAARERRLAKKRRRSETKRLRKRPDAE
jgi:ribosome-associated protein